MFGSALTKRFRATLDGRLGELAGKSCLDLPRRADLPDPVPRRRSDIGRSCRPRFPQPPRSPNPPLKGRRTADNTIPGAEVMGRLESREPATTQPRQSLLRLLLLCA